MMSAETYWADVPDAERSERIQRWYAACAGELRAWVHSRVRNRDDADDLLQDALLRALVCAPCHFDPLQGMPPGGGEDPEETARRNFRSWMFAVLRNRWKDSLRALPPVDLVSLYAPSADGELVDLLQDGGAYGIPTEDLVLGRFARDQVAQALAGLEEPLRATAYLRIVMDLTVDETRERLCRAEGRDVPQATVRSRTSRALERIRGALRPVFEEYLGEGAPAPEVPERAYAKRGPKPGSHWRPEEERLRERAALAAEYERRRRQREITEERLRELPPVYH